MWSIFEGFITLGLGATIVAMFAGVCWAVYSLGKFCTNRRKLTIILDAIAYWCMIIVVCYFTGWVFLDITGFELT